MKDNKYGIDDSKTKKVIDDSFSNEKRIKDFNLNEELYKKIVAAFVNWNKSKEEVVDILCKDGIEREKASELVGKIVPILNASKKKEALNNLMFGIIVAVLGIILLYWTVDLRSRAKWVLWAALFLGLNYVYKGVKLIKHHFK